MSAEHKKESIWDLVKVVLQALAIAFVIRSFFYQPFNIPSGSMYPTLEVGDYLFVSKMSYGYSRYSFNFAIPGLGLGIHEVPIKDRVFFADKPKRGDVVVFKLPSDTEIDYIKRVIGLPGDRIQMREGVLFINDEPVKKERIADYSEGQVSGGAPVPRYRETLPNGVSYEVLDLGDSIADNTQVYQVPEGHYFMMGDNRDNSTDSRFLNHVGYVPYENLVGRAEVIFFSLDPNHAIWQLWKLPFAIRWSRLISMVN